MTYRAAIAGCGLIGSEFSDTMTLPGVWSHADAYTRCTETELVAVCDHDAEKAARCAKRWNVAAQHTDFAAMLDDARPEIVSICTPDHAHYQQIKTALAHPAVHVVLAEKPLALDIGQAEELVELAKNRNVVLAVNYSRRYAAGFATLAQQLQSGEFGTIQSISGYYTKGTLHNGGHWFDLAEFLIGPVQGVRAYNRLHEAGNDPTLDVALDFTNGVNGYLHGLDARAFALFEMDVVCSEGRVRIVDSGFSMEIYRLEASPFGAGYRRLALTETRESGLPEAMLNAVQDSANCLTRGTPPACTGVHALQALKIGHAALKSAQSGVSLSIDNSIS
jgi:predicted dehydrogenase